MKIKHFFSLFLFCLYLSNILPCSLGQGPKQRNISGSSSSFSSAPVNSSASTISFYEVPTVLDYTSADAFNTSIEQVRQQINAIRRQAYPVDNGAIQAINTAITNSRNGTTKTKRRTCVPKQSSKEATQLTQPTNDDELKAAVEALEGYWQTNFIGQIPINGGIRFILVHIQLADAINTSVLLDLHKSGHLYLTAILDIDNDTDEDDKLEATIQAVIPNPQYSDDNFRISFKAGALETLLNDQDFNKLAIIVVEAIRSLNISASISNGIENQLAVELSQEAIKDWDNRSKNELYQQAIDEAANRTIPVWSYKPSHFDRSDIIRPAIDTNKIISIKVNNSDKKNLQDLTDKKRK